MLRALIFMLTLTVLVGIGIVKCNNDTKVAASSAAAPAEAVETEPLSPDTPLASTD
jgi:hypothetical protein